MSGIDVRYGQIISFTCHSERSEESNSIEILRFAQNDTIWRVRDEVAHVLTQERK